MKGLAGDLAGLAPICLAFAAVTVLAGCRGAQVERLFPPDELLIPVLPDQDGDLGAGNLRFQLMEERRTEAELSVEEGTGSRWLIGFLPSRAPRESFFLPVEYRWQARSLIAKVYHVRQAAPIGSSATPDRSVMFAARLPDLPPGQYEFSLEFLDQVYEIDRKKLLPGFAEVTIDPEKCARLDLNPQQVMMRLARAEGYRTLEELGYARVGAREHPGKTVVDEKGNSMPGRIDVTLKQVANITPKAPTFPPLTRRFEVSLPPGAAAR